MRNRHDRLIKHGVVALAGIAVLGWIREPEKHPSQDSAIASSTEPRATFFPPPDVASVHGSDKLAGGDSASVRANTTVGEISSPSPSTAARERVNPESEADQQTSPEVKARERASANSSRHEVLQESSERSDATRSQERREEHPLEPEVPQHIGRNPEQPQDNGAVNTGGQTQAAVGKKERSTTRSAAIIVGAAAAGAAIGAATGGGKGAAIGAISGGTGGFVYDRMTRRKGVFNVPTVTSSDTDQQVDEPRYDRAPSLACRFGTPTFN
jgi:hypothetical protein